LPADWRPDFIVLYLPYTTIPRSLWSAPVPVIGLAPDWNLLWHYYRRQLHTCDLVLTDTAGVETLRKEGLDHARSANLFGLERSCLLSTDYCLLCTSSRDIDILFIGNLNPAVQRQRLPWLGRLAQLSERHRVVIQQGVFGDSYRELMGRAKIVFNRSIRGEVNKRTFEAPAAGALLFQEVENREIGEYFRDRDECVLYSDENLEELLDYYLEHEEERRAIAEAGRVRVQEYTFEKLWEKHLELIEREWPGIVERARARSQESETTKYTNDTKKRGDDVCVFRVFRGLQNELSARLWQALSATEYTDDALVADIADALVEEPTSAELHNALGLAIALGEKGRMPQTALAQKVAPHFARAVECDAGHVVAGLNLAEALALGGQQRDAIQQAEKTLGVLEKIRTTIGDDPRKSAESAFVRVPFLDSTHFPIGFDLFRVEWERAAWANAGRRMLEIRAKLDLIRWRLHSLLASLTGNVTH